MASTLQKLGLDQLSVDERLELVRELWDSIAAESPLPLDDEARRELRRRAAEDDADPSGTVSWDEAVRAALRGAGA